MNAVVLMIQGHTIDNPRSIIIFQIKRKAATLFRSSRFPAFQILIEKEKIKIFLIR